MSICKTHRKARDFTTLANEAANNPKLGYRARGILWHLLTKPDGWEVRMKELESNSEFDGREAIRTAFKQLEAAGYAVRQQFRDGKTGQISWKTHIFETALDRDEWQKRNEPMDGKPSLAHGREAVDGKPSAGNRQREAVTIVNTETLNTETLKGKEQEPARFEQKPKSGNELWDHEFETEFWPIAFKKVSKGAAIKAYRTARKGTDSTPPVAKEIIMTAWELVNEKTFPAKAEEDGSKTYIPMPSTWLNQQKWADEDVVARLEAANSPEAKRQKLLSEVAAELRRLGKRGVVPPGLAPDRKRTYTVSELPIENLQKCLDFLQKQPTPVASPQEASHAA